MYKNIFLIKAWRLIWYERTPYVSRFVTSIHIINIFYLLSWKTFKYFLLFWTTFIVILFLFHLVDGVALLLRCGTTLLKQHVLVKCLAAAAAAVCWIKYNNKLKMVVIFIWIHFFTSYFQLLHRFMYLPLRLLVFILFLSVFSSHFTFSIELEMLKNV